MHQLDELQNQFNVHQANIQSYLTANKIQLAVAEQQKLKQVADTITKLQRATAKPPTKKASATGSKSENLSEEQIAYLDKVFANVVADEIAQSLFVNLNSDSVKSYIGRYIRGNKLTVTMSEEEAETLMLDIQDALDNGYTISEIKQGQSKNIDGETINGEKASRIIDKLNKIQDGAGFYTRPFIMRNANGETCDMSKPGRKPTWVSSVEGAARMALCINRDAVLANTF